MSGIFRASSLLKRRRLLLNLLGLAEVLPRARRPSVVIRRQAISRGLLGTSAFWRIIAVLLILRGPLERAFGREHERVASYRIGVGHSVRVASYPPTTRKQRKESGLTKAKLRDEARVELQDPNFRP